MSEKLNLICDCNYLAHRVMFKLGSLSWQEKVTGVLFGFLKTVLDLSEKFNPNEFIFCWDSVESYRKVGYPKYKGNRRKGLTEDELFARGVAYRQFTELKDIILPRIGFKNIFCQKGFEADDLIAKIVIDQPKYNGYVPHIIVSSDNDLYQVLPLIKSMYFVDKKKLFSHNEFEEEYDISPEDWVKVKAIAGDLTDNLPGVPGIGIKTAIKYIKGKDIGSRLLNLIAEHEPVIAMNKRLMTLPHPRTKAMIITKSEFNLEEFESICLENGFSSFLRKENINKWKNSFQKDKI